MGLPGSPAGDADILGERVRSVFLQIPAAVLVTTVNASLVTMVLVLAGHDRRTYGWLAAILTAGALRLALWEAWRRRWAGSIRLWATAGGCGAFVSGLLWGGGAMVLWPHSDLFRLFWVFVIGGMCAGAVGSHATHLPTAIAYIVPAALPLAVRMAGGGSAHGMAAAAMIVVFLAALAATGRRSSGQFGRMLRLQLALAERTAELDASRERLLLEVAEHQATEITLRHAQKMEAMGQLTGGIAHDFNNLLMAVLGSLESLRTHVAAGDGRAQRLLDNALQGAQRGAALTQRLLAFGRRQTLEPRIVDVPALVRAMSDLLRSSLGAKVQIETRFPIAIAPAHVDANQLELALLNLAVNARDAMPEGGCLTIAAREAQVGPGDRLGLAVGYYVVLGITDDGEGMDEATLAQATEPFFTTKEVGRGTGLGLSMVYGLAAQSGGQLILSSRKGRGTTAELWLPRAEAAPLPPLAHPETMRPRAAAETTHPRTAVRRAVLLVDDDPLVLTSTSAMIADLGHTVIEAVSGRQALEILQAGAQADMVLTDYAMPGMTGLQLADELARLCPRLPVVLATGYTDLRETPGGSGPAAPPRLAKPFRLAALSRAIDDCFTQGEAEDGQVLPFARP